MGGCALRGAIPRGIISSFDIQTPLGDSALCGRQTGASTAWFTQGVAVYMPIQVERDTVVSRLGWYNGVVVGGAVDCGVYTLAGTRLVSTASVAQSGVSVPQEVDVANTVLHRGDYLIAMAMAASPGRVFREAASTLTAFASGVRVQTVFPLPATATFSEPSTAFWPMAWINTRDAAI